jgi:SAM-dependent methyltransferase
MSDDSSSTGSKDDDDDPADWWDEVYENEGSPPWDIEEPQPAFADLAQAGAIEGRVLDAGCGTGTHALYAAERGHSAVGVDVSECAIERARAKADERDLDVTFRVANALDLSADRNFSADSDSPADLDSSADFAPFDTVLDSGLFHAFQSDQREIDADELADVVASGGRVFVLGFGEGAPEDWGPNPFAPDDVREAFADGWTVGEIREVEFETREASVPGLLAVVKRP